MDRHIPRARSRSLIVLMVAWLGLLGPIVPLAGAQADDLTVWASAFPTGLAPDIAAMALPAADYPIPGLVLGAGFLMRPVEEAAAHEPVVTLAQPELLTRMREAGWVTRYIAEVAPAAQDAPSVGWSSVTAYHDAAGAAEGFALLDESRGAGVEVVPARQVGDAARLTRYSGTDNAGKAFDRLRYTFVSGPLVGSVAMFRTAETEPTVTPDALVTLAERLLARMQAAGAAPGMPGLVVRLNPTAALPVDAHSESYYVLDGALIPHQGDSAEANAGAEAFDARYGVEANYIVHATFDGQEGVDHQPAWLVALYRVGSADQAAQMVRDHARLDSSLGYLDVVELDALPAVEGPVGGSSYTAAWADGSTNAGYRISVASGNTVAVVDISAPDGVSQQAAFALVEAQAACLKLGTCVPLPAPFAPIAAPATPTA